MKKKNCKNCKEASFDGLWGEYFCRFRKRFVRNVDDHEDCPDHKEGEPHIIRKDYGNDD